MKFRLIFTCALAILCGSAWHSPASAGPLGRRGGRSACSGGSCGAGASGCASCSGGSCASGSCAAPAGCASCATASGVVDSYQWCRVPGCPDEVALLHNGLRVGTYRADENRYYKHAAGDRTCTHGVKCPVPAPCLECIEAAKLQASAGCVCGGACQCAGGQCGDGSCRSRR